MLRPSCCRWHVNKPQEQGAGARALLEPCSWWVRPQPPLLPRLPLLRGQPGSLSSSARTPFLIPYLFGSPRKKTEGQL